MAPSQKEHVNVKTPSVTIRKTDTSNEELVGNLSGKFGQVNTSFEEEKFHAAQGHGFAAERANDIYDRFTGHDAQILGDNNAKNGPDRVVDGLYIQSKYCKTGQDCIKECFEEDGKGVFRYFVEDGKPMQIEVPSDKYDEAVLAMENKIKNGQVPGVTDPKEAESIVRKGHFTYLQAKNIAKAGTIESITYDAVNGAIIATYSMGITALITFASCVWNGDDLDKSLKLTSHAVLRVGGRQVITRIIAGQLSRAGLNSALVPFTEGIVTLMGPKASAVLINAFRKGKNIYGAAAMKSAAKLLRGNLIADAITVVIFSSVDVVNIFRGRISGKQLFKNVTNTVTTVAGGTGGLMGGSALGSLICPGPGTIIGGLVGALAGGAVADKASNAITGAFIEDDADEMVRIIEKVFKDLASEYLLNRKEIEGIADNLQDILDGKKLKDMYASDNRKEFARGMLTPVIEEVVTKRKHISPPSDEEIYMALKSVLEDISDAEEEDDEEDIELNETIIASDIQVKEGKERKFKNEIIRVNGQISCDGNLSIENCVLYYNVVESGKIVLGNNASISITNSWIVCKDLIKRPFIKCTGNSNVCIIRTTFLDCAYFLDAKSFNTISLTIDRCKFINCYDQLINVFASQRSSYNIVNNIIIQNDLIKFNVNDFKNRGCFDSVHIFNLQNGDDSDSIHFFNNTIYEDERILTLKDDKNRSLKTSFIYLSATNLELANCTFIGISHAILAQNATECRFENCSEGIKLFSSNAEPTVNDCIFVNCSEAIVAANNTHISNCVFTNCTNTITTSEGTHIKDCQFISNKEIIIRPSGYSGGVLIENCQFYNTINHRESDFEMYNSENAALTYSACIQFARDSKSDLAYNTIKECLFDGVDLGRTFLMAAYSGRKDYGTVAHVEKCIFKNCITQRQSGKIIKTYAKYDTLLKKGQDYIANSVHSDCEGLDKINSEGSVSSSVNERTVSSKGIPFGSTYGDIVRNKSMEDINVAGGSAKIGTLAMGKAFIEVCKAVKLGKLSETELTSSKGLAMMKTEFKNQVKANKDVDFSDNTQFSDSENSYPSAHPQAEKSNDTERVVDDAHYAAYLNTARDRAKYDLGIKAADIRSVDLRIDPVEKKVYSIINGEERDVFDMYDYLS